MNKAIIKINTVCNNSCIFCHSRPKKKIEGGSTAKTLRKISNLKEKKINTIYLSGGEPLASQDFQKIVSFIEKNKIKFGLITNCRLFSYKKNVESLKEKGLVYVHTSLLGSNSKIHNSITRTPGSFQQTLKGIKNVIHEKIELDVNCVVINQNLDDLGRIVKLADKLGVKKLRFSFVEPLTSKDSYVPKISLVAGKIRDLIKENKTQLKIVFDSLPLCQTKGIEKNRENLLTKNIVYMSEYYENCFFPTDKGNKIKPNKCNHCKKKNKCEGIFEKYLEIYGDSELVPFV